MTQTEPFFGELYLRSSQPFLTAQMTEREVAYLASELDERDEPILDLACGHGRHLTGMLGKKRRVVGVDFDALSLREIDWQRPPVVRGDFFHLPFRDGAFGAIYCWYNSIFTFEDEEMPRIFSEMARVMRPGAKLILQSTWWKSVAKQPDAIHDGPLSNGAHLKEVAAYDAAKGRDSVTRTLTMQDGRVLKASFIIRYFDSADLERFLNAAGLDVVFMNTGLEGQAIHDDASDLVIGARKR